MNKSSIVVYITYYYVYISVMNLSISSYIVSIFHLMMVCCIYTYVVYVIPINSRIMYTLYIFQMVIILCNELCKLLICLMHPFASYYI